MIKIDKSLADVWKWKDEIHRLNKGKSMAELVKFIKRESESFKNRRKSISLKNAASSR